VGVTSFSTGSLRQARDRRDPKLRRSAAAVDLSEPLRATAGKDALPFSVPTLVLSHRRSPPSFAVRKDVIDIVVGS
jgi:hypothetical protein